MSIQQLSVGYAQQLITNVIYALPGMTVRIFVDGAAPTLFQSNDSAFTVSVAVVLVDGQAELAGGFIRCTSASAPLITLKKVG